METIKPSLVVHGWNAEAMERRRVRRRMIGVGIACSTLPLLFALRSSTVPRNMVLASLGVVVVAVGLSSLNSLWSVRRARNLHGGVVTVDLPLGVLAPFCDESWRAIERRPERERRDPRRLLLYSARGVWNAQIPGLFWLPQVHATFKPGVVVHVYLNGRQRVTDVELVLGPQRRSGQSFGSFDSGAWGERVDLTMRSER